MSGRKTTVFRPAQCSRRLKISRRNLHPGEIDGKRESQRLDRAEVSVPDRRRKRVLVGDRLEELAEIPFVAAVGGGGDSEQPRPVEMIDHPAITRTDRVMRLVDDDGVEIVAREPVEPLPVLQRLDTSDDDVEPAVEAAGGCLFECAFQAG